MARKYLAQCVTHRVTLRYAIMNNVSVRLPSEQRLVLKEIAKREEVKESAIIRKAVAFYIRSMKRRKAA